ncbi:MAG: hypothetical protein WBQ79_14585 [Acidobacteriaceae bacterium]
MHKVLFAMLLLLPMTAAADTCPGPGTTGQKDAVPLCAVVQQVTSALQRYQSSLGSGPDSLPPLSRAEFDFKTTAVTTVAAKISLFVFTIGGSHEKDVTNDVTFIYAVPKPKPGLTPHATPTLEDQLYATIRGATEQVQMAHAIGKVPFSSLEVTVQFCVKWDANGGVNAPISLITIGLNGDKSRNTAQSVKLIFAEPQSE